MYVALTIIKGTILCHRFEHMRSYNTMYIKEFNNHIFLITIITETGMECFSRRTWLMPLMVMSADFPHFRHEN